MYQQAQQALSNIRKQKEITKKRAVEERAEKLEQEILNAQAQIREGTKMEMEELMQKQNELEKERAKLEERRAVIEEQERKMKEFAETFQQWEKKLSTKETIGNQKESKELLISVREANEVVQNDRYLLSPITPSSSHFCLLSSNCY